MFKIYDGREYFYQWDLDRQLIVESSDIKEVHFCNRMGNCSLMRKVYEVNGMYLVNVPNIILQDSFRMNVYAYDAKYTKYATTFEIKPRSKPETYVNTETEVNCWESLNERVTALEESGVVPDLSGYATEEYVNDAIANLDIEGVQGKDGGYYYPSIEQLNSDVFELSFEPRGNTEGMPTVKPVKVVMPSGESAYDVAVNNGFEGSEAEWLESLNGEQGETGPQGEQGQKGDKGDTGPKGDSYVLTDADKAEIVDNVKTEVPLVTNAAQPTFADSVDKMADTSKVYVMPDGYMWAWMKVGAKTLTADDVVLTNVLADGALESGVPRIATKELLPCGEETISISCPSPYQYFIYFYTANDTSTFIGKSTWVSGDIADVLTATIGSGTSSGAKYCRISLRDGTNSAANLTGRIEEFMSAITIKQGTDSQYAWTNTGHLYIQPAQKPYYTLQGKNITCFGDSLAANCYVGNVKQWIERVGEFFQCGKIYNRGVGGSAVSSINGSGNERNNYAAFNADGEAYLRISYKTGEAPMEIPEGYTEMKASMELDERVNTIPLDTDILLIEAGTNDNDLDAATLSAAYDRMLVKIQNRIPNAKIVILGLPFVNPTVYGEGSSGDTMRENLRNKLEELMGGIREVAKKYCIPVIELKDIAQVNLINYTNYMSNDALHYDTEAGTKRWAEAVIKGMFGLVFLD